MISLRSLNHQHLWRQWITRLVLLSFLGLYLVCLLPHTHLQSQAPQDCTICYCIASLSHSNLDSPPVEIPWAVILLGLLFFVTTIHSTLFTPNRFILFKPSRAPPVLY